jgi:bifunctional UDP-N-acetylglucosamine pyrophosphorylase/glucosamine-1-phosphate N-acetyltransferase
MDFSQREEDYLSVQTLILAAGKGTRMKSKYPKVIHPVCGLPMVTHVIKSAKVVSEKRPWMVVGFGAGQVQEKVGEAVEYIHQEQQLGTGHAVLMAKEKLAKTDGQLLILYGDTPLITGATLKKMIQIHSETRSAVTVLTTILNQPFGYGRIIRDAEGKLVGIVEDRDASLEEKAIKEINTGIYCFSIPTLLRALPRLRPQNAQGEYYLTDLISLLREDGESAETMILEDPDEVMGPNDRMALAQVDRIMRMRILKHWMIEGVTIVDPDNTYIEPDVTIGQDTRILPGTFLLGKTVIGEDCQVGPDSHLTHARVGDGSRVFRSVLEEAIVGVNVTVGPYAYLRPGTKIEDNAKVGDFVEIKNSTVGKGSKVPHLSYIGDCTIGEQTNIGAGTITCNYDGKSKHATLIGSDVFVGSNTNLVAPVSVGDGATIGAGSTITKDVPAQSLAVARGRQFMKAGWQPPHRR